MDFLSQALLFNHYAFDQTCQEKLWAYIELLQKWNRVYNLTAIHDPEKIVQLHILDSLSVRAYLQGNRILDVGSGAGLPGIPLALTCPDKTFTLLDSNSKKTRFLTQVVCELGLKNVTVVHDRAENFHPDQCFDNIVTRAFAALTDMLLHTEHLLCPAGVFLAMKGIYPESEIQEMPAHFKLIAVHELIIKGLDAKRHLVCIGKGA